MTPEGQELLRKPFPPETVGKLPRVTCKDCSQRDRQCTKHERRKCGECGAYVSTAHIHFDYVGHAAVTDRLLTVDPEWSWEPFGYNPDGLPALTVSGGETSLWIKLTVLGVTRPAVGTAASGSFELPKQLISDAIRNGAMRFGVALDLWSKEDLGHDETEQEPTPPVAKAPPQAVAVDGDLIELVASATEAVRSLDSDARRDFAAFLRESGIASAPSAWTADHARRVLGWCGVRAASPMGTFV